MLSTNMHFKNGVLIVKLIGEIDKLSYCDLDNDLTNLIISNGIRYVALNFNNVYGLDRYGLRIIKKNYDNIVNNNGKLIICDNHKFLRNVMITDSLYQVNDESKIMEVVNL